MIDTNPQQSPELAPPPQIEDGPPKLPAPGPEREAARPVRSTGSGPQLRKTAPPRPRVAAIETNVPELRRSFETSVLGLKPDAGVKTAGGEATPESGIQRTAGWISSKGPASTTKVEPAAAAQPAESHTKTTEAREGLGNTKPESNDVERRPNQPAPRATQPAAGWKSAKR
jgi:hypothetical protein